MIDWIKEKFNWLREKVKGWKTVIAGAVVGLPMALLEILEQLQLLDPAYAFPEPWGHRVALGLAVTMILLRLATNTPVGKKPE